MDFQTEFSAEEVALNRKLVLHHIENEAGRLGKHRQANFLVNQALGTFDYDNQTLIGQYANDCGTQACIAGWTVLLTVPHDVTVSEFYRLYRHAYGMESYAANALGLDSDQINAVFYNMSESGALDTFRQITEAGK